VVFMWVYTFFLSNGPGDLRNVYMPLLLCGLPLYSGTDMSANQPTPSPNIAAPATISIAAPAP
jgi:hypothetical protein